jgi:uncharacterized membrane protein
LEFVIWLKGTALAEWVLYSPWANPILLCMHAIGMALVVGCGLMTCLRILGYGGAVPLSLFERLIGFAWLGVALNAISGVLMFLPDGDRYIVNWTFQLKIGFIVLAGLSTWFLWRTLGAERAFRAADGPDPGDEAAPAPASYRFSVRARVAALVTASFWIFAIVAGRMIAYTLAPEFAS